VTGIDEFTEFVMGIAPRLRRTAFLLCGDWHTAEDLGQTTVAKLYLSWRRISRREAADAYAMRILVNTYLADRRKKRHVEQPMADVPEYPVEWSGPELRIVVLNALATLPPGARAVVVMRYWADLSVDQVAAALGCSPGNVKSQSARALAKLRPLLGEVAAETGLTAGRPPDARNETERRTTGHE
jgi:RNA polymerase sigma-70 factor (sigma-E family)